MRGRFFLPSGYSSSALRPYAPHSPSPCVRPGTLLFGMGISKKGSCFLLFPFYDLLPSLAALSDDQREEFKPRWQRSMERKWLETAPFFVCPCRTAKHLAGHRPKESGERKATARTMNTLTRERTLVHPGITAFFIKSRKNLSARNRQTAPPRPNQFRKERKSWNIR